jgi:hypothetical protein
VASNVPASRPVSKTVLAKFFGSVILVSLYPDRDRLLNAADFL